MSDTIKKALKKIAKPGGYDEPIIRAIVQSVDKNAFTCVVKAVTSNLVMNGVKLKPVISSGDSTTMGLVVFPAVGSFVLVGQVAENNINLFVISCTSVESISMDMSTVLSLLVTTDGKINLNADKITFNNGQYGIPKSDILADVISKLQSKVDDLINDFNIHTHSGGTLPGGITGIPLVPGPLTTSTYVQISDIENTSIIQ